MSMANPNAYLNTATEAQVQKAICEFLSARRIVFSVTDSSLYFDNGKPRRKVKVDGFPDITVVAPGGRFLGIECKSHSGKLRPAQTAMHEQIRKAGGVVIVARCVRDVEDWFRLYGTK
jgi:hypothetical protein